MTLDRAQQRRLAALIVPINAALAAAGAAPLESDLLTRRATLLGLAAPGPVSANRQCHLLRATDGWVALNLARADDVTLLPALIGMTIPGDPLTGVRTAIATRTTADWIGRATLLGLPLAAVGEAYGRSATIAHRLSAPASRGRLVVDLSSLWAGPFCGQLLTRIGYDVVKVEATRRPDGARAAPAFFAWMNDGKRHHALDLATDEGRAALIALTDRADIVIEGSRPRALRQLGVAAEAWVAASPGRIWVSITAHGRTGPAGNRVGFGDDAAAAGGLVRWRRGAPGFIGDAVADPLAGLAATVAVLSARSAGGGVLIDVSLAGAAAAIAA